MASRDTSAGLVTLNGRPLPLEDGNLGSFLLRHGYPAERAGLAVALNGQVVSRSKWSAQMLRAGDEIEIVGAVTGG